jgi:nicotinamidase/pyrazinamidase
MKLPEVKIAKDIGIGSKDALVIIDVQKDFMPSGALPVVEGDLVVPGINKLIEKFHAAENSIVLTQDWHTPDHQSFASSHEGKKPYEPFSTDGIGPILWPDHCVRGTSGAEFHRALNTEFARLIIRKGANPKIDSYSAFIENDKKTETGLSGYLRTIGVKRIFLCGLALDYCVFYTAMDGKNLGFDVVLAIDLTRPVGAPEGIVDRALLDMTAKGIVFTNANQVSKESPS